MRGRGLKLTSAASTKGIAEVAPRAGAWIETRLKHQVNKYKEVAPRAGAWIETRKTEMSLSFSRSPPVRGRGLKRDTTGWGWDATYVAPRAGAWIETCPIR